MKKIKIFALVVMLGMLIPLGSSVISESPEPQPVMYDDFTHTVFVEYCTTTWCPNCPPAAGALEELFDDGTHDFMYVTLASDVNEVAQQRSWWGFFNRAIPAMYVDGGDLNMIGSAGSIPATKDAYAELIEERGAADVADIDLSVDAEWNSGTLEIEATIVNNGGLYIGFAKSFIFEDVSRWIDTSSENYRHAVIDFGFNNLIIVMPGATKTISASWDSAQTNYSDVDPANLGVAAAVYNLLDFGVRTGYTDGSFTQRYVGFFADESAVAFLD